MAIIRKVQRQGNSYSISVPGWMLNLIGVKKGASVNLVPYPGQYIAVVPRLRKKRKANSEGR